MTIATTRLTSCPRCGYSLQGLPEAGRCPECGFGYDAQTLVLSGMPRGLSQKHPGRMALWLAILVVTWLSFSGCGIMLAAAASGNRLVPAIALTIGAAWIGGVVYLIATRRRDGSGGVQQFIFTAHGFANVTGIRATDEASQRLVTWDQVDTVRIDRLGDVFHRLRIGRGDGRQIYRAELDLNVRCNAEEADVLHDAIAQRIAARPAR